MTERPSTLKILSDLEISMTREFDAPRELVYRAFTDPELVPQWWGLRASTTIVDQFDLRVGGAWRFIQRMPDGTEFAFRGEFLELVPPSKVTQTFEFEPMPGHITQDTMELTETNGKTLLTVTSKFQSIEDRDGMLQSGMEGGANESYDRLAELLETLKS
jgi:uncharacterized protein YndB with AHSA1/START domain